ncbi:MAG: ABC-2 family transporter protein [Chloroflexi bacterium]|nr:ABC-2 family transporter protein [Chloroflexota bacterium]
MIRKYAALIRMSWSISMAYRAEQVVWVLTSLLSVIMMLVWLSISRGGPVNGFTSGDFVAYYMVGLVVRQLTGVWTSYEMGNEIREGTLSPQLLRPIHPVHRHVAANLAEKAMRMTLLVPLVSLVFILTPDARLVLTPWSIGAFALSVAGAWAISFLADYAIAILAFWTTQAAALAQVLYSLRIVFTGIIAPLQMFPAAMQAALNWLPFRYMLAFSSEILLGQTGGDRLWFGLLVQWAWVAFFFVAVRILWRLGARSYSAVGA